MSTRSERLELPDGDFLDLEWTPGTSGPIILILHGLAGSIQSPYAWGLLHRLAALGHRGVLMHFRGCGSELNRLPRAYHSGETGDPGYVIRVLRERYPDEKISAVGFSIGGNMLLKYLGETGENSKLDSAVAVSVPFELDRACDRIERGFSRVYQSHLVRSLIRTTRQKMQRMDLGLNLRETELQALRTFRQFDDKVTAPLHGFASAEEYYARASCRPWLSAIRTSTLILHATDDPFMTPDVVPACDELADPICLELCERGGHVGFVGGAWPWAPDYWLERRIPEYLQNSWIKSDTPASR